MPGIKSGGAVVAAVAAMLESVPATDEVVATGIGVTEEVAPDGVSVGACARAARIPRFLMILFKLT
jgi:hypothetical protein